MALCEGVGLGANPGGNTNFFLSSGPEEKQQTRRVVSAETAGAAPVGTAKLSLHRKEQETPP